MEPEEIKVEKSSIAHQGEYQIDSLIARLTDLRKGMYIVGTLKIKKRGYGKVTGAWGDDWEKKIKFRIKKGDIQYCTIERGAPGSVYGGHRSGWGKEKYGSALSLLAGNEISIRYTTKCKLSSTTVQEPDIEHGRPGGTI